MPEVLDNLSLVREVRQDGGGEIFNYDDIYISHDSQESPHTTKSPFLSLLSTRGCTQVSLCYEARTFLIGSARNYKRCLFTLSVSPLCSSAPLSSSPLNYCRDHKLKSPGAWWTKLTFIEHLLCAMHHFATLSRLFNSSDVHSGPMTPGLFFPSFYC